MTGVTGSSSEAKCVYLRKQNDPADPMFHSNDAFFVRLIRKTTANHISFSIFI